MDEPATEVAPTGPLGAYVDALVAGDAPGLRSVLTPDATLRALLPGKLCEAAGRDEVAATVLGWFDRATDVSLADCAATTVGARERCRYRVRLRRDDLRLEIEQVVLASRSGEQLAQLDLLCSGFQPLSVDPDAPGAVHRFDAGTLGCGDGLPRAFREQVQGVGVGEALEVTVSDPAAESDLPPLARMMGHTVLSTERLPDGRVTICVRRGR